MGPQIILDKSALQQLCSRTLGVLHRYFDLVLPPILIIEILGDLKKSNTSDEQAEKIVGILSNKTSPFDRVSMNYKTLATNELLGHTIHMRGIPYLNGVVFTDSDGNKGAVSDVPPEQEALLRWRDGKFDEAERLLADKYKKALQQLELPRFQTKWHRIVGNRRRLRNLTELQSHIDRFLALEFHQLEFLKIAMEQLGISTATAIKVKERWYRSQSKHLIHFAPYVYYLLRTDALAYLSMANALVVQRPTNRIDLEYLYYIPFCQVFSSSDKFHRSLAPMLVKSDQIVVDPSLLRADLDAIAKWWESLNEEEREERRKSCGPYPPEAHNSFTHSSWIKFMKPYDPSHYPFDLPDDMRKEIDAKILQRVKDADTVLRSAKASKQTQ